MSFRFHMNDLVQVKLTPEGHAIHRTDFVIRNAKHKASTGRQLPDPYAPVAQDPNGYSTWFMWQLMALFGSFLFAGATLPFNEIAVLEKT